MDIGLFIQVKKDLKRGIKHNLLYNTLSSLHI